MRFYEPKSGALREREYFAWLPITCGLETRWLERVHVIEEYNSIWEEWLVKDFLP